LKLPDNLFQTTERVLLSGVPEGLDARVIAEIAAAHPERTVLHVARDDSRLAALAEALGFFAPEIAVLRFPAWDCLPYDRVSPHVEVVSERVDTLCRLAAADRNGTRIVLATVNAALQRVPPRRVLEGAVFEAVQGASLDLGALTGFLLRNGYSRTGTVREPGEYALRGGIVDIFPPGTAEPVRLDLFGDEVERIRLFDPATQRSSGDREAVRFEPVSEILLDQDAIARFRAGYRETFGSVTDDALYVAVSEGRKQIGMEHWLPLFHDGLETLFDYLPDAVVTLDHQADEAVAARFEMIAEYFDARRSFLEAGNRRRDENTVPVYRPLAPDRLYLDADEWGERLAQRAVGQISPFAAPDGAAAGFARTVDIGGRRGTDFAAARAEARRRAAPDAADNVFDIVREYVARQQSRRRRVAIACFTDGARERLGTLLGDHGIRGLNPVDSWPELTALPADAVGLAVLGVERGFATDDAVFIGEQDILGERLVRPARRRRQAEQFIADAGELSSGDLVVHMDHGVGRYEGLETVSVSDAPHDCLRLTYAGGDRLFVPVENIEVLSRYGSGDSRAALDRLGGAAWQARKSKLKKRLRDMADELIRIAAARTLRPARRLVPHAGHFEEFCARFPYHETEDQHRAIDDTLADLESGRPMDRLVCGDVGFGKTEVALRAAFATVIEGGQVALVVPTTLLGRQHYATFRDRFAGEPVRIEQLSRLVPAARAAAVREGLANGEVDIVIGTHALLGKTIAFKNLVLLIVDEEQHFGVTHKEQLKKLRADVHVLTLTATPIPRTLQMALTGVKDMSMIATPPVDRLAVRTFITPYDPVVVREAIMREHFRGGQIFYVCPRIGDLAQIERQVREIAPEIKIVVAHGRLGARALEDAMTAFYDGRADLLLSTQIIESGLDIPTANTMIVHRADMFGLAQLYQLRGRIGRAKLRAYCYLTLPPRGVLSSAASKRLEVMQSLDSLGAGFTLASHDLDIRGAGNLLGEEQSGHIREVGVELYQHMLEEAVAAARGTAAPTDREWSPQINIGTPVLIPESYVHDLDVRLGLYRRVATLEDPADIESFAAEMIDRFGALPEEVENLLRIVAIKHLCRAAGVDKLDAGPKGAVVSFHGETFADPAGLVAYISKEAGKISLRPDHRLVYRRDWTNPARRLSGAHELLQKLAEIAG
jgi:transcription-repair coupling factor (superfamily II helicase)